MDLKQFIRDIPDFPSEGILFKDITTLLKNPDAFDYTIDTLINFYKDKGITKVCGIEARGFMIGGALAKGLNAGFVPIRKPGKLPAERLSEHYTLEYGNDCVEIHKDAIEEDDVVLIHDDLLATGGTARAAYKMVKSMAGKTIYLNFIIELSFLNGRARFDDDVDIYTLLNY
jgi:adenine phosphoribosyltransferase